MACAVTSLLLLSGASACKKSDNSVDVNDNPNAMRAGKGGGGGGSSGSADESGTGAAASGNGGRGNAGDGASAGNGGASGDSANDGEDAGPPPDRSCEVADDVAEFSTPVSFTDESGFGVATGLTGFGVAFDAMGSTAHCALGAMPVATLGAYKSPVTLFGDCSAAILDVTLLHVSDGYRLVWVDNSTGTAELQTTLLADNLALPAELTRTRLTTNALHELRPVMSTINGGSYLAWIAVDGTQSEVDLQRLDQSGDAQVVLSTNSGYRATRLALGQLGKDRGALAFVDEQGKPGIWLVPIDESGQAASEPKVLSDLVSTGNSVDLATREEDGGVVVYSVDVDPAQTQPEVRFRRLSRTGDFFGDEVKIASAPVKARDASVTRLGDGYVVAYREISSSDPNRAEIRLSLITKEGTVMRDSVGRPITHLAGEASASGGRITARISIDGQLLLGFVDRDDDGFKFRMIRKRLDCAL